MTILLLGAKSRHQPLESVPAELSRIKRLFNAAPSGMPPIEYEPYLTREILTDLLRRLGDQLSILHFAGHSSPDSLETDEQIVYSRHIADFLGGAEQAPKLVFLNGCNSAGQAAGFLGSGVSCVIATHDFVDDSKAALFAYEFYANLLADPQRNTLDQAFNRASSLTMLDTEHHARCLSFNHQELPDPFGKEWDWGIFSSNDQARQYTFADLLAPMPALPTEAASEALDFIAETRRKGLQERWRRLYQKHEAIQEDYDYRTDAAEKLRLEFLLQQSRDDLASVEQELDALCLAEE